MLLEEYGSLSDKLAKVTAANFFKRMLLSPKEYLERVEQTYDREKETNTKRGSFLPKRIAPAFTIEN